MSVQVEDQTILGIPTLIYKNIHKNLDHQIFMIHGFNNNKYENSQLALQLAFKGYKVIAFDMKGHGERSFDLLKAIKSDSEFGLMLFQLIKETSDEIAILLQHLKAEKTSIIGSSLGANVVNHLIASPLKFHKMVAMLGALSFTDLIAYSMEKDTLEGFVTSDEVKLLNYVKSLDPKEYISKNHLNKNMLLINGLKDDNIPAEFTRNIYQNYLSDNNSIEYYEEDEYHFISNSMISKVIDYFDTDK